MEKTKTDCQTQPNHLSVCPSQPGAPGKIQPSLLGWISSLPRSSNFQRTPQAHVTRKSRLSGCPTASGTSNQFCWTRGCFFSLREKQAAAEVRRLSPRRFCESHQESSHISTKARLWGAHRSTHRIGAVSVALKELIYRGRRNSGSDFIDPGRGDGACGSVGGPRPSRTPRPQGAPPPRGRSPQALPRSPTETSW